MSKFFITYGNINYQKSKERIIKQAQNLGIFDEVISYDPDDLLEKTIKNPLFRYSKGGGYWIWKPDIIYQTLLSVQFGDVIVYTDSGCNLYPSIEWNKFDKLLLKKDMVCFRINNTCQKYTKKHVLEAFQFRNGKLWKNFYQIAATVIILKKTEFTLMLIKEWMDKCTMDFIFDVDKNDLINESNKFIEHRHDQSIFTALVYDRHYFKHVAVMWNNFDKRVPGQAIFASRISDFESRNNVQNNRLKTFIKIVIVEPMRTLRYFFWLICNNAFGGINNPK